MVSYECNLVDGQGLTNRDVSSASRSPRLEGAQAAATPTTAESPPIMSITSLVQIFFMPLDGTLTLLFNGRNEARLGGRPFESVVYKRCFQAH